MERVLKDHSERADATLIEEAAQCVRRYPLGAMAAAFGGGMLAGLLITHNLKTPLYKGRNKSRQRSNEAKANKRALSIWENEGGAYLG